MTLSVSVHAFRILTVRHPIGATRWAMTDRFSARCSTAPDSPMPANAPTPSWRAKTSRLGEVRHTLTSTLSMLLVCSFRMAPPVALGRHAERHDPPHTIVQSSQRLSLDPIRRAGA